jgi:hypothetical protein
VTWVEFRDLVFGLLQKAESRLWRATRPDDEPTQQGE